jgi:RNA ligase
VTDRLHIGELLDLNYLDERIASGYVRVQQHPSEPLEIYNYTEKAQYEQAWDVATLNCRGLIAHKDGTVVARGFQKFFNYGDPHAGELDATAQAVVVDKMDGSLGIIYPASDGWAVATRGSFASDQAIHATELLRRRYPGFAPPNGVTVLAEIIYPENRIVCDYGGADDLFLLGGVDIATGRVMGPDCIPGWTGPAAKVFAVPTLADALAMPPRAGAEGLVVRLVESGHMVKLKQADYLRIHALVTRTSSRTIWEFLAEGRPIGELIQAVPDEFRDWVDATAASIAGSFGDWTAGALREFADIGETGTRREFAEVACRSTYRAALFRLYDGRSIDDIAWKAVRPEYVRPFVNAEV